MTGAAAVRYRADARVEGKVRGVVRQVWLARPPVVVAMFVIAGVAGIATLGPLVAPLHPQRQMLEWSLQPPGWRDGEGNRHLLGTDQLGRDVFARLIYGARTSLTVGLTTVALSGSLGVLVGLVAGYSSRAVDSLIGALVDSQLAIPLLLLLVVVLGLFGHSLWLLVLVLGVTGWVPYTRTTRAETLGLRAREFVQASEALGAGRARVLLVHLLPNVLPSAIVLSTLMVSRIILTESALGFLGLGVQPPDVSWGSMLADGRPYMERAWWLATFPGVAIVVIVLAINMVGDWLRDMSDPRQRGR